MTFMRGDRVRSLIDDGFVSAGLTGVIRYTGPPTEYPQVGIDPSLEGCAVTWDNLTRSWAEYHTLELIEQAALA